ncbi:MAG: hypothetical protein HOK80_00755 [Candidatus Cloacimonetes bacterium]|nr:hypothetical protein [Candidatus Cloacimonadota bacterium]
MDAFHVKFELIGDQSWDFYFKHKKQAEDVVNNFKKVLNAREHIDYEFTCTEIKVYENEKDLANDVLDALNQVMGEQN